MTSEKAKVLLGALSHGAQHSGAVTVGLVYDRGVLVSATCPICPWTYSVDPEPVV